MFRRIVKSAFLSTSMMVLVLLASMPEVICCCNISWGPVGLFGGGRECTDACKTQSSCCCEHESSAPAGDDAALPQWRAEKCTCAFHVVSPNPMSADQPQAASHVLASTPLSRCDIDLELSQPVVEAPLAKPGGLFLTAASFCAVMQTWSI